MSTLIKTRLECWVLRSFQIIGLSLVVLALYVPYVFAETVTETIKYGETTVEIQRVKGKIVSIKEKRKRADADVKGTKEIEETFEYDEDGRIKRVLYKAKTYGLDQNKQYRLLQEEKTEDRFDQQGRLATRRYNSITYGLGKKELINQTKFTEISREKGLPVATITITDELKDTQVKTSEITPSIADIEEQSASEQYEDVLKRKRDWDLKNPLGKAPAGAPLGPAVPGTTGTPGEYAEVKSIAPLSPAAPAVFGPSTGGVISVATRKPDPSFYGGLFLGPSMTSVNGLDADYSDFNAFAALLGKKNIPCAQSTMVSAGFRFGTWGNWGVAPEWTKYLGLSVDFSYQKLDINTGMGTYSQTIHPFGVSQFGNVNFTSNGYLATLGLMVNARYGFLPDENISTFGTIQPFFGVGPVLGITSVEPSVTINGDFVRQFGRQSSTFLGLGLEAGVRYLPHRNIYLETSFRYFYGRPSFEGFKDQNFQYNFSPDITTQTVRFGVGFLF